MKTKLSSFFLLVLAMININTSIAQSYQLDTVIERKSTGYLQWEYYTFNPKTKEKIKDLPYTYISSIFTEDLAQIIDKNGKYGFISRTGKEIIPPIYDNTSAFYYGLAMVKMYGKHGFIDKTGKVVIPLKYDEAGIFIDGLACVKQYGKSFYIDKTGKEIEKKTTSLKAYTPDIKTGLVNFTLKDESNYLGNFSYLFTYNQALKNCPTGYRIPTLNNWLTLLKYIINDAGISHGSEHNVIYSIGTGWDKSYQIKEGAKYKNYTTYSKDKYGLNISPLANENKTYNDTRRKVYWLQPEIYEGKMVDAIQFTADGFEFIKSANETTKACVRYVKIK